MRARPVTRYLVATATVAVLAITTLGADAAYKTLDGKRVKTLTLTAVAPAQTHDTNLVAGNGDVEFLLKTAKQKPPITETDPVNCKPPACSRLTFVYLPALGVRNKDLMLSTTWTNPAADIDLYFVELRNGRSSEVEHCATSGPPSEKIFVPARRLTAGRTYALVAYFFRTANETVTTKVQMGVPSSIKKTVPASVDDGMVGANLNCAL
jgi:hypothetical protein